jgi:enoyl-CoA hydratase
MSEPVLLVEKDDGVAVVTLNRPGKMNSLSRDLRRAIVATFRELDVAGDVDVAILTGSGRAFCAGLDLGELSGDGASGNDAESSRERENAVAGADVVAAVEGFGGPVIGAINGFAITGGFELALACDVLIASEEARFADTHARVGILPGWGLSQKLARTIGVYRAKELSLSGNFLGAADAAAWGLVSRVVPASGLLPAAMKLARTIGVYRAKELSLSGNFLGAADAAAWGLVSRVVPASGLLHAAMKLARDMQSCPRAVLRAYKRLIDEGLRETLKDGLALEQSRSREHMRSVSAADIGQRRAEVQSRGRTQNG